MVVVDHGAISGVVPAYLVPQVLKQLWISCGALGDMPPSPPGYRCGSLWIGPFRAYRARLPSAPSVTQSLTPTRSAQPRETNASGRRRTAATLDPHGVPADW